MRLCPPTLVVADRDGLLRASAADIDRARMESVWPSRQTAPDADSSDRNAVDSNTLHRSPAAASERTDV
jgi:hypothetical protein